MYQMVDEGDLMLEGEEDKGKDDNKEDKDNVKKEGGASQESTKDTADAGQIANNSKRGRLLVRGGLWEVQVTVWPASHYSDQSACFSWRKGLVWNTPCYKAPKV